MTTSKAQPSNDATFAGIQTCAGHNVEIWFHDQYKITTGNVGWYWWPCASLDVKDTKGPFPTAEGAYLDAMGE